MLRCQGARLIRAPRQARKRKVKGCDINQLLISCQCFLWYWFNSGSNNVLAQVTLLFHSNFLEPEISSMENPKKHASPRLWLSESRYNKEAQPRSYIWCSLRPPFRALGLNLIGIIPHQQVSNTCFLENHIFLDTSNFQYSILMCVLWLLKEMLGTAQ